LKSVVEGLTERSGISSAERFYEGGTVEKETDLETIYHAEGESTAELEALTIRGLLEANGIGAIVVGDPVLPNLPFEVKVAREDAERARRLIAQADRKTTRRGAHK
jgi:hypothetical protein